MNTMVLPKPRVLIVTPRYPFPVIGGDRLRIFHLCRELSIYFDLTLISLSEQPSPREHENSPEGSYFQAIHTHYLPKWKSLTKALFGVLNKFPMQSNYYWDTTFAKKVKQLSKDHDACIFHLIRTARYEEHCDSKLKILELTDAISRNYRSMDKSEGFYSLRRSLFKYESNKLGKYERAALQRFKFATLVSKTDIEYLRTKNASYNLTIPLLHLPNGIDISNYPYRENWTFKPVIGIVGNITSLQNFDACFFFATEVLPILQKEQAFELKIIGRIGHREKNRLEKLPNVKVTGEVDSIADALADVSIGVCPVRVSAGIQNKILEYLAAGLPSIVSTTCGEALDLAKNKHTLFADSVDDYVRHIHQLRDNPGLSELLRVQGRKHVEREHDWKTCIAPLAENMLINCKDDQCNTDHTPDTMLPPFNQKEMTSPRQNE